MPPDTMLLLVVITLVLIALLLIGIAILWLLIRKMQMPPPEQDTNDVRLPDDDDVPTTLHFARNLTCDEPAMSRGDSQISRNTSNSDAHYIMNLNRDLSQVIAIDTSQKSHSSSTLVDDQENLSNEEANHSVHSVLSNQIDYQSIENEMPAPEEYCAIPNETVNSSASDLGEALNNSNKAAKLRHNHNHHHHRREDCPTCSVHQRYAKESAKHQRFQFNPPRDNNRSSRNKREPPPERPATPTPISPQNLAHDRFNNEPIRAPAHRQQVRVMANHIDDTFNRLLQSVHTFDDNQQLPPS